VQPGLAKHACHTRFSRSGGGKNAGRKVQSIGHDVEPAAHARRRMLRDREGCARARGQRPPLAHTPPWQKSATGAPAGAAGATAWPPGAPAAAGKYRSSTSRCRGPYLPPPGVPPQVPAAPTRVLVAHTRSSTLQRLTVKEPQTAGLLRADLTSRTTRTAPGPPPAPPPTPPGSARYVRHARSPARPAELTQGAHAR